MIRYNTTFTRDEETQYYNERTYASERTIWLMLVNVHYIIRSVYRFENFEKYCSQLMSDRQEDKKEIYWKSGREGLMDYVKISIAFENLNKALLLKKGILVHKIDKRFNKDLSKKQNQGKPIRIVDFLQNNYNTIDFRTRKTKLNGLLTNFDTISYSHTLNDSYQEVLNLNKQLVGELKEINRKRNKLHFFTEFSGAYEVSYHIRKWNFIRDESYKLTENELKKASDKLKEYN